MCIRDSHKEQRWDHQNQRGNRRDLVVTRHAGVIEQQRQRGEDVYKRQLLIRDGRKLLLTDTGRVVFERGQAILGEFSQLESELSDICLLYTSRCV